MVNRQDVEAHNDPLETMNDEAGPSSFIVHPSFFPWWFTKLRITMLKKS
jgi:hypothetical protein